MTKEFIPYEQSLALKELGFNESCFGHYWKKLFYSQTTHHHPATMPNSPESCLAPTFSQAFRWFREKYDLIGWIEKYPLQKVYVLELPKYNPFDDALCFNTYEEAELACLNKLIEIVNNS